MKAGIFFLVVGYVLSQFYRSFLAVLTPVLAVDIGATAADLSFASGIWFLVFAAMQIPVGLALDRVGPRSTASILLALGGGGGAAVMALAEGPVGVTVAMALFGIGGSPVLMASYYIFARVYPQAIFATLAGATIGVGSLGNLLGTAPLAWVAEVYGWRAAMWGLCASAFVVAAAVWALLGQAPRGDKASGTGLAGYVMLLRNRNLLLMIPLLLVNYAPAAGLRGLWAGPYFGDVFALDSVGIGRVTLVMAIAMALGSFTYGFAERIFGHKKSVVLTGNLTCALLCIALAIFANVSVVSATIMFTLIGLLGVSFPVIMAHGQMFMPTELTGRGMTLLNLCGIGGVALMQFLTSAMARWAGGSDLPQAFYNQLFLLFGISVLIGCAIYAFSQERPD